MAAAPTEPPRMSEELIRWKDHSHGTSFEVPAELRERAVRLVIEVHGDHEHESAAIKSVAAKVGITSPESLRKWRDRPKVDGGVWPGKTSEEVAEIKKLRKENAELRRANEILEAGGCRANGHGGPTRAAIRVDRPPGPRPVRPVGRP